MKTILHNSRNGGFTLVEIMMVNAIFAIIMLAICSFYLTTWETWKIADLEIDTSYEASRALSRIVYGIGPNSGIRSAKELSYTGNPNDWILTINAGQITTIKYDSGAKTLIRNPGSIILSDKVDAASAVLENNGVTLSVTVNGKEGKWDNSKTMTTFVAMRNSDT